MTPLEFFATASPGTERALHDELIELGLKGVRFHSGGIPFLGAWADAWRVCLHSRIALRVMVVLGRFPVTSRDALYDGVAAAEWRPFVSPRHTIAVGCVCQGSQAFTHSGMAALVVKDAIVDGVRAATGRRPSVDRDDPDVRFFIRIAGDKGTLYLDLAGVPLSQRGYRTEAGEAPLRETLAAAILRMAGWDAKTDLLDPMCGSGTIPIEAAMWAGNVAPGLLRARFGFERWAGFDEAGREAMRELRGQARQAIRPPTIHIQAADVDEGMLTVARANARRAGVKLAFKQRGIGNWEPDGVPRLVIMNPPYDERLEANSRFCRMVTAALCRMHGCRVAMITALPEYRRVMSLAPALEAPLQNGPLDCRLLVYDVP